MILLYRQSLDGLFKKGDQTIFFSTTAAFILDNHKAKSESRPILTPKGLSATAAVMRFYARKPHYEQIGFHKKVLLLSLINKRILI